MVGYYLIINIDRTPSSSPLTPSVFVGEMDVPVSACGVAYAAHQVETMCYADYLDAHIGKKTRDDGGWECVGVCVELWIASDLLS